jgi:hypothetical protein
VLGSERYIDEDKGTKAFRSPTCVSTALFLEESDVADEDSVMEGGAEEIDNADRCHEEEA